jgi:FkbM family methyltransferase
MNASISKPKGAVRAGSSEPGIGKRLKQLLRKLSGGSGARQPSSKLVPEGSERLLAEFRKLVKRYCAEDRLAVADHICQLALEIEPHHPWFALTHAKIADNLEDSEKSLSRWRRVIEISGAKPPVQAFKKVADGLLARGRFEAAEKVILAGLERHPEDFHLRGRLARAARAAGFTSKAISIWREMIAFHPMADTALLHRKIAEEYWAEGLPERALAAVDEGLVKHPQDPDLRALFNRIASKIRPLPANPPSPEAEDFTRHLFGGRTRPFGRGVCTVPISITPMSQHMPALLDFGTCQAPFPNGLSPDEVDVFFTWGSTVNPASETAIEFATAMGKPHLSLEFGFLSSAGLAINQAPQHSLIICPGSIYYDSTRPSFLEDRLNSEDYQLDENAQSRAADCIRRITIKRVTKYNHAPQTDMRSRFPANGTRRVLLVDQRFGDNAVEKGLGSFSSFQRMWKEALSLPDHEILVKLHPDAISGGQGSYFARIVPAKLPANVTLITEDVNPYCLFEVVDSVFVCTSQLGFEALMAGLEVRCFGVPFYAGWGLTQDRLAIPRRKKRRTLEEIFHLFYIDHSRYFIPDKGISTIEEIIEFLAATAVPSATEEAAVSDAAGTAPIESHPLRILIVLPSPRFGASGRYIQTLSNSLVRLGCEVMVLAEGKCPASERGVAWRQIAFDGMRLAPKLREEIKGFAPDVIYENGVRSRAQRAALEIMLLTGARLAVQSEDDDVQVFETHHGKEAAEVLALVDKPTLTTDEIAGYLGLIDLKNSVHVLLDPALDRWVEPLTRMLCYRLAGLHTGIWKPFTERLAHEYGMPTLVVPPVAAEADFDRIPLTTEERSFALQRWGIDPGNTVIFIGGALYNYSDEFSIFLDALNRLSEKSSKPIALIVTPGRSSLPVSRMARQRLRPEIAFAAPNLADDAAYMEMLKASDIICSPGLPDTFNRYRLPSRLVKAMAMGKPVLTCRCGFGESLEHGVNAFLTEGADPDGWALAMLPALDAETRHTVGGRGRVFARAHFDSDRVAIPLKAAFEELMTRPDHSLSDRIERSPGTRNPSRNAIASNKGELRSGYDSTMQEAIQELIASDSLPHTVVHCGAGRGSEVEDYCRMGAGRILLIEACPTLATELARLTDLDGAITVKHAAISPARGKWSAFVCANTRADSEPDEEYSLLKPSRLLDIQSARRVVREESVDTSSLLDVLDGMIWPSERNLLVLELNGLEGSVLESTPTWQLQTFQWICMRLPEQPLQENACTLAQVLPIMEAAGFDAVPASPNRAEPTVSALFTRKAAITQLMKRCCREPQQKRAAEFFNAVAGHAERSRAQLSQDLWALWESGLKRNGYFVEFGAMDGVTLSNTWLLEKEFGWSGIVAEPNPIHAGTLSENRDCVISLECVAPVGGEFVPFLATEDPEFSRMETLSPEDKHESAGRRSNSQRCIVPTISLNELLERSGAPSEPDFLSIDTEGSELSILESLDFDRWKFRAIAVEHNYTGAEGSIDDLLVSKGYTRRFPAISAFDGWYVRRDTDLHS